MNQQQITDEVKRLAKEIAKYWRMEIYKGCWVKIGGKIQLVSNCNNNYFYTGCNYVKNQWTNRKGSGIPIPDIGDCLEKLRELGGWWNIIVDINSGKEVFEWGNKKQGLGSIPYKDDSDFYFLLLSALLAVLKEGK